MVLADVGIRFGYSIILIASVNYLGLGLAPPAADWGLMIAENQQYISLNEWAVLAPAIMLAMLTICVNLLADGYVQTLGSVEPADPARPAEREHPRGARSGSRADGSESTLDVSRQRRAYGSGRELGSAGSASRPRPGSRPEGEPWFESRASGSTAADCRSSRT